jgi:putative transposase
VIGLHKSAWYYRTVRDDSDVKATLLALAEQYPTIGFDTHYGRIRNEGLKWNKKRVLRVYRKLGLSLRRKHRRRLLARNPEPLGQPECPNESWSMDFMSDALENGRRIRVLNIVDDFNWEVLWSQARLQLSSGTPRKGPQGDLSGTRQAQQYKVRQWT